EECADQLNQEGKEYLDHIRAGATRMGRLIDDLLMLARTARCEMSCEEVDLSQLAQEIALRLQETEPRRKVAWVIAPQVAVEGDGGLLRVVLENLLGNAWKFTSRKAEAHIEFGVRRVQNQLVYFVSDNGAGFNMRYADKLFVAFQRLHDESEFSGT